MSIWGKRASWAAISHRLKPDAAKALDVAVVEKAHPDGVNADAVCLNAVTQRIMTDNALTMWMDGGKPDDTADSAGLG